MYVDKGVARSALRFREDFGLPGPVLGLGCIHRNILNPAHARGIWGFGGMPADDDPLIDAIRPSFRTYHDMLNGDAINHHEDEDGIALYARQAEKRDCLESEIQQAADFLPETSRPWCETVVVYSNHDDFVRRWLNKPSGKVDVKNSKLWHHLNYVMRECIDRGKTSTSSNGFCGIAVRKRGSRSRRWTTRSRSSAPTSTITETRASLEHAGPPSA